MTQAFGLTEAEADVAIGIVSGKSLAEIAAERGIKIGIVRARSKTVFAKTQTRGQAELTGVLTRLAFVVPRAEGQVDPASVSQLAVGAPVRRNGASNSPTRRATDTVTNSSRCPETKQT